MPATTQTKIEWNSTAEEIVKFYNTDLTGKVTIVTGSNSGIGLETARVLSSVGAKVIIPCRTLEKSNGSIEYIKKTVPNADLVPMQLDLSDLSSIRAFAQSFLSLNLPLNILINNAGIMACPKSFIKDDFETNLVSTILATFYFAPSRIVIVSSMANSNMLPSPGIDFDNLNTEKKYSLSTVYGQSKLSNVLHAKELQRRFDAQGVDVTVTSLHPGVIKTNLTRHVSASMTWDMISSTSVSGCRQECFYSDNAINTDLLHEQAENKEMSKKLWEVSEQFLAEKSKRKI